MPHSPVISSCIKAADSVLLNPKLCEVGRLANDMSASPAMSWAILSPCPSGRILGSYAPSWAIPYARSWLQADLPCLLATQSARNDFPRHRRPKPPCSATSPDRWHQWCCPHGLVLDAINRQSQCRRCCVHVRLSVVRQRRRRCSFDRSRLSNRFRFKRTFHPRLGSKGYATFRPKRPFLGHPGESWSLRLFCHACLVPSKGAILQLVGAPDVS